jgi:hypothetical protein
MILNPPQTTLPDCQSLLRGEEHREMWDACAAAAPATANGLRSLLQVLSGDEDELKGCTASWLELFVAEVLHCYPHLKPQVKPRRQKNPLQTLQPKIN